jgi:glucoamylase
VDQDYVFNWTRDAAVTAIELAAADLPTNQSLIDYVTFAKSCQDSGPPIGYASYTIEGRQRSNWSEQSDGPALRTRAILQLYGALDSTAQAVAREVIATDVSYLLSVYQQPTRSLWEERDGYSFFARAVQLRCFAELADNTVAIPVPAGVSEAANWLQARLPEHWNTTENIYVTFGGPAGTSNPPPTPDYDPNVDVVMSAVYGAVPSTDTHMLATAARIRSQWTDPASPFVYPINAADQPHDVGPLMGAIRMTITTGTPAHPTRWATHGCLVRRTSPSCTTGSLPPSATNRRSRSMPGPHRSLVRSASTPPRRSTAPPTLWTLPATACSPP